MSDSQNLAIRLTDRVARNFSEPSMVHAVLRCVQRLTRLGFSLGPFSRIVRKRGRNTSCGAMRKSKGPAPHAWVFQIVLVVKRVISELTASVADIDLGKKCPCEVG